MAALVGERAAEPLCPIPPTAPGCQHRRLGVLAERAGRWRNRWREACEDARLLTHLATLPADVFKVEADNQMIALYWAERGEPEVLQRIDAVLKALA